MELSKLNSVFTEGKEGNLFGMFKIISKHEPELIRNQVNSYAKHNESFFTHYLNDLHEYSYTYESERNKAERKLKLASKNQEAKDFLSFCESYGYQLTNDTYLNNSETYSYKFIRNEDKETIPDYLVLLKNAVNDDFMLYVTEKLGKDYLLELNKEWDFLPVFYRNNCTNTIKKLTEYGCYSNTDILKIVKEERPDLVTFYWEMVELSNKNNKNSPNNLDIINEAFKNDLEWVEDKISKVLSGKDVRSRPEVERYLNQRMPSLNSDQQHQLITKLLASKNSTYLSLGFKAVNKNSKTYKDNENNPLWTHLGTVQNFTLFQTFLEKKLDWETFNEPTGKYFINEVFKSITTQKIELPCNGIGTGNKNNAYIAGKIANYLDDNLPKDFWLKTVPNNTHTWYAESMRKNSEHIEYISKRVFSLNHEGVKILEHINKAKADDNLNDLVISNKEMQSVREILDKTYFSRDVQGNTTLDYLTKKEQIYYSKFNEKRYLNNMLTLNILTPEHQKSLLETYLNFGTFKQPQGQYVNEVTKILYDYMLENTDIDWKTVKIDTSEKREKELANFSTYFEIKARIFMDCLNSKVPNKEYIPTKKKI